MFCEFDVQGRCISHSLWYSSPSSKISPLKENGEFWSWGENLFGQLGIGLSRNDKRLVDPTSSTQLNSLSVITVVSGRNHFLALTGKNECMMVLITNSEQGEVYGWGSSNNGRLGIPNLDYHPS